MSRYKQDITPIPVYNDGEFKLFVIKPKDELYPEEYIKTTKKKMFYEDLSLTNNLKFEAEQREKNIIMKIRIPQTKEITSLNVLKISNEYYKVYNAYHFTNKYGFKQTDLTLEVYSNAIVEEKKNGKRRFN